MGLIFQIFCFLLFYTKIYLTEQQPLAFSRIDAISHNNNSNIKYLVYECKNHCGGWADRLKGSIFNFLKNNRN